MTATARHDKLIQEQFSQQSATFGLVPSHSAESSLEALIQLSAATETDVALDVACGPGIVTCALAPHVRSIRGQDVVPAMIERAREREQTLGLTNVSWDVSDSNALPYSDESFDLVVTRFSFHHLIEPLRTLRELMRVCKRRGRILVVDVAPEPGKSAAYNSFEKIRDPSHTHALTEPEFNALFAAANLPILRRERYGLPMPLEAQLAASFPEPGGAERLRQLFEADLGIDDLGVQARLEGQAIHFTYPVLMLLARKAM